MPYQLTWIVPQRVLMTTFSGVISQSELQEFVAQVWLEMPQGISPVYHISDSLAMGKVQLSMTVLSDLVRAWSVFSKLKVQVDINRPGSRNAFLASFGAKLINMEAYTVASLAEAMALLKRIDGRLLDLPWQLQVNPAADNAGNTSDQVSVGKNSA